MFGFTALTSCAVMVAMHRKADRTLQWLGVIGLVVLNTRVSVHYTGLVLVLISNLPANKDANKSRIFTETAGRLVYGQSTAGLAFFDTEAKNNVRGLYICTCACMT